jgi:hypothetical protein
MRKEKHDTAVSTERLHDQQRDSGVAAMPRRAHAGLDETVVV